MGARKPLDLEFLQPEPHIRAGRVKVLVAFGDVTGFGAWTRRGSNSQEEVKYFMVELYKQFIRFRNGNGYFMKLMGDGFLCVTEIGKGNGKRQTSEFLSHAVELKSAILYHESIKKILNGSVLEKAGFDLKRANVRSRCPRGVDPEDIRTLWKVYPLKDSTMAQAINKSTIPT